MAAVGTHFSEGDGARRALGSMARSSSSSAWPAKLPAAVVKRCPLLQYEHSPRRPPPELLVRVDISPTATRRQKDPEPWHPEGGGTPSGTRPDAKRSLFFSPKWRAENVRLSPDLTSASWRNYPFGGFLVSHQPLTRKHHGCWFEVRIEAVDSSLWSDGLGIGVALHPATSSTMVANAVGNFEGFAYEQMPQSWLVGYDGRAKVCGSSRYLQGSELPRGPWRPAELRCGDVVGLLASHDGSLMLFVNNLLRCVALCCNVPQSRELFAVLDLDGCTKAVHVLDTNGAPSPEVLQQAARFPDLAGDLEDH